VHIGSAGQDVVAARAGLKQKCAALHTEASAKLIVSAALPAQHGILLAIFRCGVTN
jgi:hypothetical protein